MGVTHRTDGATFVAPDLWRHRCDCAVCKIGAIGQYAQNEIIERIGQFGALVPHALKIDSRQGEKSGWRFG